MMVKLIPILSTVGTLTAINEYKCHAFTMNDPNKFSSRLLAERGSDEMQMTSTSSRRIFFKGMLSSTTALLGGGLLLPQDDAVAATKNEPIIWKSGKQPIIPDAKPKDKNDTSGTRKDPDFLRSIATCKVSWELDDKAARC